MKVTLVPCMQPSINLLKAPAELVIQTIRDERRRIANQNDDLILQVQGLSLHKRRLEARNRTMEKKRHLKGSRNPRETGKSRAGNRLECAWQKCPAPSGFWRCLHFQESQVPAPAITCLHSGLLYDEQHGQHGQHGQDTHDCRTTKGAIRNRKRALNTFEVKILQAGNHD